MPASDRSDPVAQAGRYFDAWRRRDAGAVLDTLAPEGRYEDPLTGGPLGGAAFAGYMQGLWAAFPDLDFDLGPVHRVADGEVHARWTMRGHNHGSFHGLPPTGRAVALPGIDVIEAGPQGIRRVQGYFDSAVVPRQLGLDVLVQPREAGPFRFGNSVEVHRDRRVVPGVLGVTELMAASDEHVQPIKDMSRQTILEQLGNPAFLGFTAATQGRRMTTVSAWSSHEALSAALRTGTHAQAMQRFFHDGIVEGGYTAVFAPVRIGPFWRRCGGCGTMSRIDGVEGSCTGCGAPVQALA